MSGEVIISFFSGIIVQISVTIYFNPLIEYATTEPKTVHCSCLD